MAAPKRAPEGVLGGVVRLHLDPREPSVNNLQGSLVKNEMLPVTVIRVTPTEIYKMLNSISDKDAKLLGFLRE